ncbi:MAG: tRNA 4-thiouridine(8) synthase ThiI [Patescibacteria group bacterium]
MKKTRALVLLSGGLDSRLAAKILSEQKIEVIGLHFVLPFGSGCCSDKFCIFKFCQKEGIELKFIDCLSGRNFIDYLKIVRQPKFGYGKNLNPCLDCRIFMLKKAGQMMKVLKANFIATGEVLGQRPMSQHLKALKLIDKETGLEGKILRPLSAKLLPETEIEKQGLVDRQKLFAISGRRRLPQLELAKKFNLENFPQPAGGCLLTDPGFSQRLREMFKNWPDCDKNDIELLKVGRNFWQFDNLIVVGRNQEENKKIENLVKNGDIIVKLKKVPGPTTLIRVKKILNELEKNEIIQKAKNLTQCYSPKVREKSLTDIDFCVKIFN